MEDQLSPDELALHDRIDEILWNDWDPLGISKIGGARDEYYAYLPDVFRMTQAGAPSREIAEYLHSAARDRMGLLSSLDQHLVIAEMIQDLKHEP